MRNNNSNKSAILMNKLPLYKAILLFCIGILYSGCFNDLNTVPIDEDVSTSANIYEDPANYKRVLAKLYAGLAVTGQQGPAGNGDIGGIDEGFGQYLRMLWYHQELTTDEAVIGWNDQTIADFHEQDWTTDDGFTYALYSRIFYQVSACNEFLRQTTDQKLSDRGVTDAQKSEIQVFRAEARFLRALSYWHALDHFRNVPFVTEEDIIGNFFPEQTTADKLFTFIESELKDIEGKMLAPRTNEYGRADQSAAWMLLAKLYLNAEVYIGAPMYESCNTYCEKVINSPYQLEPNYRHLFGADNHLSPEIIFPVVFDGIRTRTYGGTTFIINASIGGNMNPRDLGMNGGWGGTRTTPQLVDKFPSNNGGVFVALNYDTRHPSVFIPGSFQGFDGKDATNKIATKTATNDKVYEGYRYFAEDNGGFVVLEGIPTSNISNAWGDADGDGILTKGGGTIPVSTKGLYKLTVDLNAKTYKVEAVKLFLEGSALPGGQQELMYNPSTSLFELKTTFAAGTFQIVNLLGDKLGDIDLDGTLSYGEATAVPEAGFEIKVDMLKPPYTYSLNLLSFDNRGAFFADGQTKEIEDIATFSNGYGVNKFTNLTRDGVRGQDGEFADTDFPMFRLADAYLMSSEALYRLTPSSALAVDRFNKVRERAYRGTVGNVTSLDLGLILDERAREFYWEGHRRTDLVRFANFTNGSYLWQWKGGVKDGKTVDSYRNVFPIPARDIAANPTLKQNEGYQ